MTIFHRETIHGFDLTIGQEWHGAGLYWELHIPAERCWPLPRYHHRSSGRFYPDSHGERIHGETVADVVQTARSAAIRFAGLE